MPRKGHVVKPEVLPDPIYNSKLVTSLINHLMIDGKRGTASKILYAAFDQVKEQISRTPHKAPTLWLNPEKKHIEDFEMDDIKVLDYHPEPAIKAPVAV